jgi:hypothetical protein
MPTNRPATRWPAALLVLAAVAAPAFARSQVVVRNEPLSFALDGVRQIKLDVPVGEIHVTVGAVDRIEGRLELRCDRGSMRCRDKAEALRLNATVHGDDLVLRMGRPDRDDRRGINHPEVDLRLTVPAALAVSVDMGVGELHLDGVEGDVAIDLGVGEVDVSVPEAAVRSVSLDVGVGEAHLSPRVDDLHRSGFLFLGNEVDWREGRGRSRVSVDVGVGEARVHLDP